MGNHVSKLHSQDRFPMSKLFDKDLGRYVLKHLELTQLLRIEHVNKQWQSEVHCELRRITQLAVYRTELPSVHYDFSPPTDFCEIPGHRFAYQRIYGREWTLLSLSTLIRKLSNLEAVYIGGDVLSHDLEALAKCSKLRHVEINRAQREHLQSLDIARLECLYTRLWEPTVRECPNLKYLWAHHFLTTENFVEHLRKDLRGIKNLNGVASDQSLINAMLEHGQGLRIMDISNCLIGKETITRIGDQLKDLRTFTVYGDHEYTDRLTNFSNLDTLQWDISSVTRNTLDYHLANLIIGRRLKRLELFTFIKGDIINAIEQFCPNLRELNVSNGHAFDLELTRPFRDHSHLKFLSIYGLRINDRGLRTLLTRLPNLRAFKVDKYRDVPGLFTTRADKYIKHVARDFPKVIVEIF